MTIVVVDDDRIGLMLVAEILGRLGRRVLSFSDPLEAQSWLRSNEAALLVTDLRMVGIDGLALTEAVRACALNADTPVMMLTTASDHARRMDAFAAGVTDFAVKPVDPTELHARASALLRLSLAQAALKDRARHLALEVEKATSALVAREEEVIRRLATAADRRDHVTGDHVARVAEYARLIAEAMGLAPAEVRLITLAAPLHDIGKIGVPDAVLSKRANLTAEERAVMQQHTLYAAEILGDSSWDLLRVAADIGVGHHEHWDGTGYPHGLAGTAIPVCARIVAVADVFDALVSQRPYKQAWPLEQARAQLIELSGRKFDPACVEAFLSRRPEACAIAQGAATGPQARA